MAKGLQQKGIIRRNKMLREAVKLFYKNGYEKTTTASIARAAGMAPSSFFAAFESKEALLLTLVKIMFENQFASSREQSDADTGDQVLMYAVETSLQLCITELSEPLRELYVTAYSLPTTSEYIYSSMADKLYHVFAGYLPDAKLKDFYEMDIASAGIMRAYMARPCDMYFTMDHKLRHFLQSTLTIYNVPAEKQDEVITAVRGMDLKPAAQKVIAEMVRKAEQGLDILSAE